MRRHGRCGAVAGALAGPGKRADGIRSPLGCDSTPDRTRRGTLGGRTGRGAALARPITTDDAYPAIAVDDVTTRMQLRAAPATIAQRPTRSDPSDSKSSTFPVRVCDLSLPRDASRAIVAGRSLPLPTHEPKRIVVIGDTGCRLKASEDAFQACNDGEQWPFAAVAAAAAATLPDLVIHVGDYHYREKPWP